VCVTERTVGLLRMGTGEALRGKTGTAMVNETMSRGAVP